MTLLSGGMGVPHHTLGKATVIIMIEGPLVFTPILLPDTCDLKWQSIRNDLIIAAFFISVTSFCGVIITLVIVLAKKCRSSKELELEKVSHYGMDT